ncbi:toxin ParE1/3/4 [Neorhizobium sp. 2083]|uniref:type II toxin-antitoxin system RelE/ParE family toxin n=1 Tax=Neorhizobium sp. 2083 TaxID=2817762 RepID=UPI00285FB72D|nr:type II toxin-antitoxin system RelE/ParE family toxin [Neorhizobium sp. 2083]MDR6816567.1 toxin ParE1/3/4 [Neorhizobium sp. 2083]
MIVIIKPAARSDILRQVDYYGGIGLRDIAERFFVSVQSSIDVLARTPLGGSPRYFADEELLGLRSWPVKSFEAFRIYYIPQDDRLIVLRVLHGRRDVEGIFDDDPDADH